MIFDSRYDARKYAEQQGWKTLSTSLEEIAFNTETETFLRLVRRGGFVFEPWFVWDEVK